ncbi:Hypothetical predicted protein [Olea europaea subsp. europaea]|uniref:Uncharacterized protein n=1 Tax=Olea europaea subsp. europaea TaxID=158383 RepID=A0A8S0QT47_OLEEU|nr:Hypothetical predicted protein [Olea europaea subsp. europaea]
MTTKVRWSSMPRVSIVQDEEDSEENENGSKESEGSLSADDNDAADRRKRGPNHSTNGCADESGRIPLTQQYSWPKNKDNEVKAAWNTASTDRLQDIFCLAQKKAMENSKSENIIDWKGYGPPWLSVEHWNDIIEKKRNNEGWKKKSKLGRDNRLTIKSGTITKHTAGSIKIAVHKQRLEKYDIAIHEKYGSNVSQPKIDIEAWGEAIPGPSKGGRLYGLGIQRKSLHEDVTSFGLPNVPYDGQVDFINLQEEFHSA